MASTLKRHLRGGGFAAAALACVCFVAGAPGRARTVKSAPAAGSRQEVVKRALVIGNGSYRSANAARFTQTAVRDAEEIGRVLAENRLGFKVDLKTDLKTKAEMEAAINAFGETLTENSIALFFYAGHAVQIAGNNYLVPTDVAFATTDDVKRDALDMDVVYNAMWTGRSRLSIIILDACRNNPFPKRALSTDSCAFGLAPPPERAPRESLIAYATDPNDKASDEVIDGHSYYTGALLKYIRWPGLRIEEFFKLVNTRVDTVSQKKQRPWMTSTLSERNKETYFSEPIYMVGKMNNGDDELIVVVNDEQRMVWTINGSKEIPILLRPGNNSLFLQVYNGRTFRDIPRLHPEGWSYSVCFTTTGRVMLRCFEGGEDRPETGGPRHGKSFRVATATIHVDEESGAISFPTVNMDVWR